MDVRMTNELRRRTMKTLPWSVTILKLSTWAFVGGLGLLPIQASAQFSFPIPRFDLRPPPAYHSVPSHHPSSQAKQENSGSSAEKDATQAQPNASQSTEHQQQQVSRPTGDADPSSSKSSLPQNNADTQPVFAPSR
jgi:cytoskeletal protein RodZ